MDIKPVFMDDTYKMDDTWNGTNIGKYRQLLYVEFFSYFRRGKVTSRKI